MSDVTIKYKGETIAEMNASGQKTVETGGRWTSADIVVEYTKPAGGGANLQTKSVRITDNGDYVVTPDAGYDGMDEVPIAVAVTAVHTGSITPSSTVRELHINVGYNVSRFLIYVDAESETKPSNSHYYAVFFDNGTQAFWARGGAANTTLQAACTISAGVVNISNAAGNYTPWTGGCTYRWHAW